MSNEEMISLVLGEIKSLRQEMQTGFEKSEQKMMSEMQAGFSAVQEKLDQMAAHQHSDVIGLLKVINNKTDRITYDIEYLRDIISRHDMDISRLKKQVESN